MDFRFTEQEEHFREELREFLRRELPSDWDFLEDEFAHTDELWEFCREFKKTVAQNGWLTITWPREYGGQEASHMTQVIFNEEMAYFRAPDRDIFGTQMLGPTLLKYGTDEQKREILPPIARGEVVWCQGFSEPGAGSDLASVQLRAVEDGDSFILTGSKIWISRAHASEKIFLLARTDTEAPKHRGISFLLCSMDTPGVTVRPIVTMAGMRYFGEVFFDGVRVPKRNLVGEQNRGFYVAAALLDFERSGVEYSAVGRRTLEDLVNYARRTRRNGRSLSEDQRVRQRLADMAIEINASQLLSYRTAWLQSTGQPFNKEASMAKLYGSQMLQRLFQLATEVLGLDCQVWDGPNPPRRGRIISEYLEAFSHTIRRGTSEIQRNIIAQRGLGLPRE